MFIPREKHMEHNIPESLEIKCGNFKIDESLETNGVCLYKDFCRFRLIRNNNVFYCSLSNYFLHKKLKQYKPEAIGK